VASFTPWLLYPRGRSPWHPLVFVKKRAVLKM